MSKLNIRFWLYPVVTAVAFIISFLVMRYALDYYLLETVLYSGSIAASALLGTRIAVNAMQKNKVLSFKLSAIWHLSAIVTLVCFTAAPTWATTEFIGGLVLLSAVNAIGYSASKAESVELSLVEKLKAELKFRLVGDTLQGAADPSRPLIVIDGKVMTVNEADASGHGAAAADGLEYIKALLK